MKKFISRHWIIFVSLIVALATVFFYVPFILTNPPGQFNPCPGMGGPGGVLCDLSGVPVSLFGYLQDREPVSSINWGVLVSSFIIIFTIFYGELKLILFVIKSPNKKKKFGVLLLKILAIAFIIYIPLFIISLISAFFGYPSIPNLPF